MSCHYYISPWCFHAAHWWPPSLITTIIADCHRPPLPAIISHYLPLICLLKIWSLLPSHSLLFPRLPGFGLIICFHALITLAIDTYVDYCHRPPIATLLVTASTDFSPPDDFDLDYHRELPSELIMIFHCFWGLPLLSPLCLLLIDAIMLTFSLHWCHMITLITFCLRYTLYCFISADDISLIIYFHYITLLPIFDIILLLLTLPEAMPPYAVFITLSIMIRRLYLRYLIFAMISYCLDYCRHAIAAIIGLWLRHYYYARLINIIAADHCQLLYIYYDADAIADIGYAIRSFSFIIDCH